MRSGSPSNRRIFCFFQPGTPKTSCGTEGKTHMFRSRSAQLGTRAQITVMTFSSGLRTFQSSLHPCRSAAPSLPLSIGNQGQIRCGSLELILIGSASSSPLNRTGGRRECFLARRLKSLNVINHVSAVQVSTALFQQRKREKKKSCEFLSNWNKCILFS